jgi:glycosyltransferase involved in cell wall biosynthesis
MSKTILFLLKSQKTPSSRIRIAELLPFLDDRGIKAEIEFIPKSFFARRRLFKKCKEFDLTVFQKRMFSMFEFFELRKYARRLAFDFDDAVFMKNAAPSLKEADYVSRTRQIRFKRILTHIDFAIVANSYLADACRDTAPGTKVFILPSSVDMAGLEYKEDYTLASPPVIGWIGSKVTHRYLEHLAPALCELRRKREFVLNVISDKELNIPGLEVNNIQWSREVENCEIRKFDIGIMPLSEDPFSRGKASYKLLQYMAAGVPSVASAVGMNIEVAGENSEYAMLADTPDAFISAISELMESLELRTSLGKNGREKIVDKYSKEIIGAKFAEIMGEC